MFSSPGLRPIRYCAAMFLPDPLAYAKRQLSRDQLATQAFPMLLPRKLSRMTASPLGYLRGAAPLF